MVSPLCEVRDGAGAYASAVNGVNVTPGNTVTLHLIDTSARSWSIACLTTDELSVAATVNAGLTINAIANTATLTAPVAGRGYRFQSIVNGGIGPDGKTVSSYSTTFTIYTLASGNRVICADETTEGDSTFGWLARVNALIRSGGGGGGGSVPTGTGVPSIVGGVQQAAAVLVTDSLVSATAAVAGTKISPAFGPQDISTGAIPAASGAVRLANAAFVKAKAVGAGDLPICGSDASDNVCIGGPFGAAGGAAQVGICPATTGYLYAGATQAAIWNATTLNAVNCLTVGTASSAASAGAVRLNNNTAIRAKAAGAGDLTLIATDASDNVVVGGPTFGGGGGAPQVGICPASFGYLYSGATNIAFWGTSNMQFAVPLLGRSAPFSVHGETSIATAPPFSVVASDYIYNTMILTNAGAGNVTIPAPADAAHAYDITIINTGAGLKTITTGAATTYGATLNTISRVHVNVSGVHVLSSTSYP